MVLSPEDKRAALEDVLAAPAIARSERSAALLRYIGEAAIDGRELTPYAIAFDIFDRDEDFDPSTDPIVRVAMTRLRKALQDHAEGDGAGSPVQVTLPQRSYVPEFSGGAGEATPPPRRSRRLLAGGMAGLLLVAIIGAGAVLTFTGRQATLVIDNRPVVGVLPFSNLTGTERLDFLGAGMQYQIASDLWRFGTMDVLTIDDPGALGVARGGVVYGTGGIAVDYLLGGSIVSDEAAMTVSTSLRHADSNVAVWRGRTVRAVGAASYGELLADVSHTVSSEVGTPLGAVGRDVLAHLGDGISLNTEQGIDSYVCLLRYASWVQEGANRGHVAARACLERLVAVDPDNSMALSALAWMIALSTDPSRDLYEPGDLNDRRQRALEMAQTAVRLSPGSDISHEHLGLVQWVNGREEAALASFRRASSLNPNDPRHKADIALFSCLRASCEDEVALAEEALRLDPLPPAWYYAAPAVRALMESDYDDAMRFAVNLARGSDFNDCAYLVAAAAFASRLEEAEYCRDAIERNRELFRGDPLGASRFWIRRTDLLRKLDDGIARSGF
ncbi:hypothetical protein AADZ90_004095 [Aestuariibius sp. 2305UL40-4]|uniref:hypothetical protein n=1 Tax=Aestuariibius violaceus TaxID=3234132 RepID=UPI00345F0AB9